MKLNIRKRIENSVFGLVYKATLLRYGEPTSQVKSIAIFLLIASFILPIAINQFIAVNTDAWDTNIVTVWDNLPILCIVALLIGVLGYIAYRRR